MPSNTYLVTSFSYTEGCDTYFKTCHKAKAIPYVLQFGDEPLPWADDDHSYLIKLDRPYPGNTGRLLELQRIMDESYFDESDWFVFTDTADVEFQRALPDLSKCGSHILVASEGKKFGEVSFWRDRVPTKMLDWDIYNVGCFAMRKKEFFDFLDVLNMWWLQFKVWFGEVGSDSFPFDIPLMKRFMGMIFNNYTDTIAFNEFIRSRIYVEEPALFGCRAFHQELGNMVFKYGLWKTKEGKTIAVVHSNGHYKEQHVA